MDVLTFHLGNVNWWAVILATLVGWILGALWYSPALFAKPWMKAMGVKPKAMQDANAMPFVASAGLTFIAAAALATLMCALDFTSWQQGAVFGAIVGLVFVAGLATLHCLFDKRKGAPTIYFIDTAYDVVLLAVVGGIIGAW